jgi:hypothetical protein
MRFALKRKRIWVLIVRQVKFHGRNDKENVKNFLSLSLLVLTNDRSKAINAATQNFSLSKKSCCCCCCCCRVWWDE